jgi:hypothetical protein
MSPKNIGSGSVEGAQCIIRQQVVYSVCRLEDKTKLHSSSYFIKKLLGLQRHQLDVKF